jgi:YVTN family beta-propeller protein
MMTRLRWMIAMTALLLVGALNVQGFIPDDADGDGVPDSVDVCPAEDASGFDRNGDGCIDDAVGPRHVEYWGWEDSVITYVINSTGAPGVGGTADNDAIIAAFNAWTSIPGTNLSAVYGGTVAQGVANGLDRVNLVTFVDNTYPFGLSTLAVGLSTSFESDTLIAGRVWRKGEIFDADMLFSPTKTFKVGGAGPGSDIQSTAAHEAGHLFGIAHTAVRSATMHYVLPGGFAARSLTSDDDQIYYRAYATSASLSAASRLRGTVTNGQTSAPVPGALVFAIDASNPSDTAACVITMPDGSYDFAGLADGNYYVAIYPLDGTSAINYIGAGNINEYTASIVDTDFLPEYYDAAESNMDIGTDKTAVAVTAGSTTTVDLVTNIDGTPPVVLEVTPASGSPDVAIDGAYLVRFSERVDVGTISASFSFKKGSTGTAGNIAVIKDDSVIVFTPSAPLDFSTAYTLRIDTDLKDRAGNALASDFTATFTTEAEPPLSISSLAPNKGVPGTTLVINGRGFSVSPEPTVDFNGTPANVINAAPGRLVVVVPDGVTTGDVVVTNPDMEVSNALVFTALSDEEVARGYESGTVNLAGGTPYAIALAPDGSYAYIASQGGVEAVVVDAGAGAYLTRELIADPAEYTDIAITPDGSRAYAVSPSASKMIEVMSDQSAGLLFNTILSTRALNARPRGIEVDPFGYRAYIATDAAEVQVWDVRLGSPSYQQQVGVLPSPDGISLPGGMAITPDGSRLLVLGASGEVFFYALGEDSLVDRVPAALSPKAIAVDPQGQRAYVTHDDGTISVLSVGTITAPPFFVQSISTGGLLRGLDTTPAGLYLYVADRGSDNLKIVDLDETHTTFRSVIANAPMPTNPVDIVMSGDGIFAYSVLQGDGTAPRMVVTTIGLGPTIRSMVPQAGQPGTKVVITGTGLAPDEGTPAEVDFNGLVVAADRVTPTELIVTVPNGVTSGPVTARAIEQGEPTRLSNSFYFEAIAPLYLTNGLREAATLEFPNTSVFCDYLIKTLAFSPDGSYLYVACGGGDFCFVFDIRPGSPDYNQVVGTINVPGGTVSDIAITADGKVAVMAAGGQPRAFYCDPNDPRFGTQGPAFDFTTNMIFGGASSVATSPDNRSIMLIDGSSHMFVDATGLSDGVAPVVIDQNYPPAIDDDVIFHPSGRACFMLNPMSAGALLIYNTDPLSPNFGNISAVPSGPAPTSIDVSRDGKYVFVYSGNPSPNFELYVMRVNCEKPDSCFSEGLCPAGSGDASAISSDNTIRINPQGTFAIRTLQNTGFIEYDPTCPVEPFYRSLTTGVAMDYGFTPDGRRIYAANAGGATLKMYDFLAAQKIVVASGDNQAGVTNTLLPAPIRVMVQGNPPLDGVPVTFEANNNGMLLTADGFKSKTIVATDAQGFAEIQWKLGDVGANTVSVSATGLSGSPFSFSATANVDPSTLPLSLAEVVPLNGSSGVSPTTALLATFSRAIDPATISSGTLYLRNVATTTTVAATYGFTDSDRKVSLTPSAALSLGTAYELVLGGGIEAASGGGALTNPGSSSFTTLTSVPLRLSSVSPPSALAGVSIVLSGSGFDATPSNNRVLFNGVAATPTSGGPGSLVVNVPLDAIPGLVRVVAGTDTSNARSFTVLRPSTSTIDEVLATVPAGSGAKSCAVSPDGALIYTVSTDGDVIIPVDAEGLTTYPAIRVGDQPVAIVIHPNGTLAYVANFNSGTVSVIDTNPDSPNFNTVLYTITVGSNPADLAVDPDGSRVAVANAGSSNVSVIDSDASSTTYNAVLATVPSGAGAKSVAVSPDGTIYVGTNTGFLVISASNAVLTSVPSGSGSKSLAVSPDGTLLFILTDDGDVLVVDIQDGSPSENQVLLTVPAGSGGKSLAVSADGTLLYVIPEVGDEVLVYSVEVIAGVSATGPDAVAPSFQVKATVIDTLTVGPDPSDIAIDPSGTGTFYVVNAGNSTLSVFGPPPGPVAADIRVTPRTLNLQSNGKYVTGRIQLPAAFFAQEIVVSSIRLQGVIPAVPGTASFQDEDGDGIQELQVKFDRAAFQAVIPQGELVPVTIEGDVRNGTFAGEDTIRTIRPTVTHPHAGTYVAPGQSTYIAWTNPQGPSAPLADVHVSLDNGASWSAVAVQVANTGQVAWTAPAGFYDKCRVLVTLWRNGEVYGQGMSQDPFMISAPVPTRLKTFDITLEDGAAVLRWETGVELGMEGFAIVRSESELGVYREVTAETIRASGEVTGGRYEFRDESVTANRTYWYKLQEITTDGLGSEFGPYSVVYKLSYGLEANVPNPFNPTTTIKYALAADGPVSLTIYDVRGSRVRELVNERQRADVYRVVWDGSNDNGERVASGMYFYRLVAGPFTQTKKMMLLK